MSQASITMPTSGSLSGVALAQNINNALAALGTDFAGATDPTTITGANVLACSTWADTGNLLLKRRSVDNSQWITIGVLDSVYQGLLARSGGQLTGSINEALGSAVASAASPDIWGAGGNSLHITGTTAITGFAAAPQAGARRKLVFDGALTLTNGSNLILPGAANITTVAGDSCEVLAETTTKFRVVSYQRADGTSVAASASGASVRGARSGLVVSYPGTSAAVTVTANELVLESAANAYVTLRNVNLTANSGNASGAANSLDTGSWAFSTIYYLYAIYNPTTQTSALLWSLSATAPTLPTGYTYYALISGAKTQAATSYWFLSAIQYDCNVRYKLGGNLTAFPTMASGTATAWTAVSVTPFCPTNTRKISVSLANGAAGGILLAAPNNSYSTSYAGTTTVAPINNGTTSVTTVQEVTGDLWLESTNVYWSAGGANCVMNLLGYELNL